MGIRVEGYDVASIHRARVGWWVRCGFRAGEPAPKGAFPEDMFDRTMSWRPTQQMAENRGRRWLSRREKQGERFDDVRELVPSAEGNKYELRGLVDAVERELLRRRNLRP